MRLLVSKTNMQWHGMHVRGKLISRNQTSCGRGAGVGEKKKKRFVSNSYRLALLG